jgi:hypothetical protein
MPHVFISYADADRQIAEFVHTCLLREGLNVFMAAISLQPGARWDRDIIDALKSSKVVLFLASEAANASAYVQQELGAAISAGKDVIPIVWNMEPDRLPGFLRNIQALDLRHNNPDAYAAKVSAIANRIRKQQADNQSMAVLIASVLLLAFIVVAGSKA